MTSVLLCVGAVEASVPAPQERTQFVVVSFDMTPIWKDTIEEHQLHQLLTKLRAARPDNYDGPDPTFTVFISTGFLQLHPGWDPKKGNPKKQAARRKWRDDKEQTWKRYRARKGQKLFRVLKYARDPDQIEVYRQRLKTFEALGVEVASHGVTHENGEKWGYRRWQLEFKEHQRVVDYLELPKPAGFRAPFLLTKHIRKLTPRDPFYRVMREHGMRYSSTKVEVGPRWPRKVPPTRKDKGKPVLWEIALETALFQGERLLMFADYGELTSQEHTKFLMREFDRRYQGGRSPLLFGGHGEQMRSIERVMHEVCYRPQVRCGTMSEIVEYMDAHPGLAGRRGRR